METLKKVFTRATAFWQTLTPQTKILVVATVAGIAILALWLS